jgi:hypothetical protein
MQMSAHIHMHMYTNMHINLNIHIHTHIPIHIHIRRDLRAYSAFPQENEVLLSPNVKLVVTEPCTLAPDGFYYVDLVERRGAGIVF